MTDNNDKWHGGKGSKRRQEQISKVESNLRWELVFGKPTEERKNEILKQLKELM